MDFEKMGKRIASETAHVVVTEDPNRIEVTFRGKKHSGTWTDADDDGNDGEVEPDEGSDGMLLHSAMLAWGGQDEEDIPVSNLEAQGYWTAPVAG